MGDIDNERADDDEGAGEGRQPTAKDALEDTESAALQDERSDVSQSLFGDFIAD